MNIEDQYNDPTKVKLSPVSLRSGSGVAADGHQQEEANESAGQNQQPHSTNISAVRGGHWAMEEAFYEPLSEDLEPDPLPPDYSQDAGFQDE
jgi:hypothetical protein